MDDASSWCQARFDWTSNSGQQRYYSRLLRGTSINLLLSYNEIHAFKFNGFYYIIDVMLFFLSYPYELHKVQTRVNTLYIELTKDFVGAHVQPVAEISWCKVSLVSGYWLSYRMTQTDDAISMTAGKAFMTSLIT